MINAIKIEKSYGALNALKALSLHIPEGECYGLLGPNGAGKTTAIHILCSLLIPDGGTVHINQIDAFAESKAVKQMIGVVPQEISLYNELSALENLKFWGGLYGLSSSKVKERAEWALKRTGLWDRKDDLLGTYSGGMQRRVNIASAILHSPKVLFMDEPTVGIDPQSRYHIYELIEELHAQGMTLL
ncbi:MAG: ABC-2 type transport system ATP-binding protein, partial [Limisphaerales bacterium]